MSSTEAVKLVVDGAIARVTLNRPERRNGMNLEMVMAMHQVLEALAVRREVAVVVLTGAGGNFCVGADLGGGPIDGEAVNFRQLAPTYHITRLLHEMPQVTIAAIDGGCAGAGLAWAVACDLRFASERAQFSTAFLNLGLAGDMGAAWVIQQAVGPAKARELFLFPDKFGAMQALECDLVTRIFSAATLEAETERLALELASKSPFALASLKANLVAAERLSLGDFIELEGAKHMHLLQSPECAAAVAEFIDSKKFKG